MKTHVVKVEKGDALIVEMPTSKEFPDLFRFRLVMEDFDRYYVARIRILGRDDDTIEIWTGNFGLNCFGVGVV
jgi:hypothetical protein